MAPTSGAPPATTLVRTLLLLLLQPFLCPVLVAAAPESPQSSGGGIGAMESEKERENDAQANKNLTAQLHEREFVSPQARVQMDCQRDRTLIRVNFTRPFNGILGAGSPETTKCKVLGSGERYHELQVLHNATDECGAKWDAAASSIANTLFIRFHQSLETGADIAKNVLCRLSVGDLVVGRRSDADMQRKKQPRARIIKAKRNE